jgi:serine/threonine protein kinase
MLANYRLLESIGEGGMGVIWKAEDTLLDRAVAIKVLLRAKSTKSWGAARKRRWCTRRSWTTGAEPTQS